MDNLVAIRLFEKIVETGNFSEAGRMMGLAPSSVSRQIAALEDELSAVLFTRNSRRVVLTDAGRIYHQHTQRILSEIHDARQAVRESIAEPNGLLRVTAPVDFGHRHVAPALADFLARYPRMNVEMILTDQVLDLNEDAADLAIRIGKLRDSSLIARRIAPNHRVACASPAYLARAGHPSCPQDLATHNCLTYPFSEGPAVWKFRNGEGIIEVPVTGTLTINNGHALRAAAIEGLGIIVQPLWMLAQDLTEGRLLPILPTYQVSSSAMSTAVHAVYPNRRYLSVKIRLLIDFLVERFSTKLSWDDPSRGAFGQASEPGDADTLVST
ncbi:LysR family transcriptional regulator [Xanthobacter autotrophicus DSM 431]|uniref:LysR family transcriptional regulator n=1 Tax=Xanthobacter nonsaccharivorans TaxID=3119912 RepID=UPI00372C8ECE